MPWSCPWLLGLLHHLLNCFFQVPSLWPAGSAPSESVALLCSTEKIIETYWNKLKPVFTCFHLFSKFTMTLWYSLCLPRCRFDITCFCGCPATVPQPFSPVPQERWNWMKYDETNWNQLKPTQEINRNHQFILYQFTSAAILITAVCYVPFWARPYFTCFIIFVLQYPLSSLVCFMVLMYEGDALLSGWALSQRKADLFKPSYWFHTFHGNQSFAIGFEAWVWRLFLKAICVLAFVWHTQLFICHFCASFKLPSLGEALGLQPQFSLKDCSFEKYLGLTRDTKSTSQRAGSVNCQLWHVQEESSSKETWALKTLWML